MIKQSQVTVRLSGGLGNQMFQYAFGRAVASLREKPLVLSTFQLSLQSAGVTPRPYGLDVFKLAGNVSTSADAFSTRWRPVIKRLPALADLLGVHYEQSADFYPEALTAAADTFDGYWQSHRYFEAVAPQIARDFVLKAPAHGVFADLLAQVSQPHSVMLHVRRGDYVSLAAASAHHGALGLAYYRSAMARLKIEVPHARCFVFSDDIPWCREALDFLPPGSQFVEADQHRTDAQDLVLMSHCSHAIIANSSFSWWAAWLGDQRKPSSSRIVCAPKRWFATGSSDLASRLPKHWIQL
ncbi:alpha-1,2-fucosyltransferase [Roseateles sp. 22389]|uniref:alpha-1,2-fucosyltransferase n=1 Tax=Roseateles sp. 22389 TaxID=3453916 RepID=UPI003F876B61